MRRGGDIILSRSAFHALSSKSRYPRREKKEKGEHVSPPTKSSFVSLLFSSTTPYFYISRRLLLKLIKCQIQFLMGKVKESQSNCAITPDCFRERKKKTSFSKNCQTHQNGSVTQWAEKEEKLWATGIPLKKMSIPAGEYNKEKKGVEGLFYSVGVEGAAGKTRGESRTHGPRAKLTWLIDPCSRFSTSKLSILSSLLLSEGCAKEKKPVHPQITSTHTQQ